MPYSDFLSSKSTWSTFMVMLYQLFFNLKRFWDILLRSPVLRFWLTLSFNLSTWYCAIKRFPTRFSSSMSLFSSLVCILYVQSVPYSIMNFANELCPIGYRSCKIRATNSNSIYSFHKLAFRFLLFYGFHDSVSILWYKKRLNWITCSF